MVAASSKDSQKPSLTGWQKNTDSKASGKRISRDHDAAKPLDPDLPSVDTCITHLRLLAAFSRLRTQISSTKHFEISGTSRSDTERRWIIFIACAVQRFEKWLATILPGEFKPSLERDIATHPREMDELVDSTAPLIWSVELLPPLDVLMVLHSYMLNPHDFLHDCLRNGAFSLWKAGFPWHLIAQSIDYESLEYQPSSKAQVDFEDRTGLSWSTSSPEAGINLSCPNCSTTVRVDWKTLYSDEFLQMDKGNTSLSFAVSCPNCSAEICQNSLSNYRLRHDLKRLIDQGVVLPGTILSIDGRVPTARLPDTVEPTTALLNTVLREQHGEDMIRDLDSTQPEIPATLVSLCSMNDKIFDALTDNALVGYLEEHKTMDHTNTSLLRSARRWRAVYDRNFSPFALDLVGAVIRQGVFVEKMQDFDWVHSPAVEHTVWNAIDRYSGFFKVMQQNPGKTAVPTFDVDLVWHTQQLSPITYYKYSLEHCNNVFIDHDDKIVDDVLNNSFEWTCDQFNAVTGNHYDTCLCWCCAILEKESIQSKDGTGKKLSSRVKGFLKSFRRDEMLSESEAQVIAIQTWKFEKDYAAESEKSSDSGKSPASKKDFFRSYIWHYPQFAPHPEEVGAG